MQTIYLRSIDALYTHAVMFMTSFIQLAAFSRKRLSEKVHPTIPKGIVGGFEFTVLQRNLKELARKAMKMCLQVLMESNKSKFDRYSRQKPCIDQIPYYLSGSRSRAHFLRQPFSKKLHVCNSLNSTRSMICCCLMYRVSQGQKQHIKLLF